MPNTARDYCITLILIGFMFLIVTPILIEIFGPEPLANPLAAGIFLSIMILCCCLLSMNRVIISKLSSFGESKKCPECRVKLESNASYCPNCGIVFQHTQGQGVSSNKVLEKETQEIKRAVVRSISTHEGKLRWIKEQFFELKRPIQEIADDLGESIVKISKYLEEIVNNSNTEK